MVTHINLSTLRGRDRWISEFEVSLVPRQLELHIETLSCKTKQKKTKTSILGKGRNKPNL